MNEITPYNQDFNEMQMMMRYCEVIAKAPAYASMGGLPGIFAVVMSGKELGLGPMASLNGGLYLIPPGIDKEGKPKGAPQIMLAARTMSMMIAKAGHKIEEIENVDGKVTLKGTRKDTGVSMQVTMTLDMARKAGLSHGFDGKPKLWSPWFKNMDDMLWKTCLSKLARRLFADVIGNAYEPSEFEEKEPKSDENSTFQTKREVKKLKIKEIATSDTKKDHIVFEVQDEEISPMEAFCRELKLIEGDPDHEDMSLIDYVKICAQKSKKSWHEMLTHCMNNRDSFLAAYEAYQIKQAANAEDQEQNS